MLIGRGDLKSANKKEWEYTGEKVVVNAVTNMKCGKPVKLDYVSVKMTDKVVRLRMSG